MVYSDTHPGHKMEKDDMLHKEQLATMLEMQAAINARVDPNWVLAEHPYLRAAAIEAGEAIEHHGWKWWKAQECDMGQLRMELVDLWHFAMSHVLLAVGGDVARATDALFSEFMSGDSTVTFDGRLYNLDDHDLVRRLELMMGLAVARRFSMALFETLLVDCGMGWADLYRQYVGKNVLNLLRQDLGYKDGSYVKIWAGLEDNQHLVEILAVEDASAPDFRQRIYVALEARYKSLTGSNQH